MKYKLLAITLLIILISVIVLNELYLKKEVSEAQIISNYRIVELAHNYTKKNLDLNLSKGEYNLPVSVEDKILVYIPTSACAPFVDRLLEILANYQIDSKTLIFVSREEQVEYILGFNDRFLKEFKVNVTDKLIRNFKNDIAIYTTVNREIDQLLVFNEGYEKNFKEYFEKYLLKKGK